MNDLGMTDMLEWQKKVLFIMDTKTDVNMQKPLNPFSHYQTLDLKIELNVRCWICNQTSRVKSYLHN